MVVNLTPKRIGTHWMQCPKEIIRNPFEDNDYNTNLSKATAKFSIGEKTTWILLIFSFVMNTLFQRVLVPYTAVVKTYWESAAWSLSTYQFTIHCLLTLIFWRSILKITCYVHLCLKSFAVEMSSSWNFPAQASTSYEGSKPSRAGALQFSSWNGADNTDNMSVKKLQTFTPT